MATTEVKPLTNFWFHFTSSRGKGRIEARMLPRDNENEFDLLARACKEVLESNSDAEGWQITGVERLDEPVIGE